MVSIFNGVYTDNLNEPCHSTDLEIAKVRSIFLLRLSGEFVSQKLYRVHRRDEVVYVVLGEVASTETTLVSPRVRVFLLTFLACRFELHDRTSA